MRTYCINRASVVPAASFVVMVALIAVVALVAVTALGGSVRDIFSSVASVLTP